jgi:hypothetical protein
MGLLHESNAQAFGFSCRALCCHGNAARFDAWLPMAHLLVELQIMGTLHVYH